jgi:hypothetical protein
MDVKIFATPFGGHGTTAIRKLWRRRKWPIYIRPDFIFSPAIETYDLDDVPIFDEKFSHWMGKGSLRLHRGKEWTKRTDLEPQDDKTIREQMTEFLLTCPFDVILFGKCSLTETFLTNIGVKNGLFLVRHVVDAYDSLYGRQHGQWCKARGGIKSIRNVQFYCKQWNAVVKDMLCSHHTHGNPIIRYETLAQDLENAGLHDLANLLGPMWYSKPKREFTTPEVEECMRENTREYFDELYNQF